MGLPKFFSEDEIFNGLQSRWAAILDPIIERLANNSVTIEGVILSSSSVVNHSLGKKLTGWQIIRQRGSATIYDRQDTNLTPEKTLLLSASSGVSVDILCF